MNRKYKESDSIKIYKFIEELFRISFIIYVAYISIIAVVRLSQPGSEYSLYMSKMKNSDMRMIVFIILAVFHIGVLLKVFKFKNNKIYYRDLGFFKKEYSKMFFEVPTSFLLITYSLTPKGFSHLINIFCLFVGSIVFYVLWKNAKDKIS